MGAFATVLLDPLTALLFGGMLAIASVRHLADAHQKEVARTVLLAAGWGALYAVSVSWLFFHYPDWMFAYLKDGRAVALVPSFLGFLLICAGFGAAGALAGAPLVAGKRWGPAVAVVVAALLSLAAMWWLQWRQYVSVGTLEEYLQGRARPLASGELNAPMMVPTVIGGVSAFAVLGWRFFGARRRASIPPSTPLGVNRD